MQKQLKIKFKEALTSVLPSTLFVLLLHFTIAPMPFYTLILFLVGAFLLILGMAFFSLGADISMMNMGEKMGAYLMKSRKLPLVLIATFLIGVFITIAEPDLSVLATQTPSVPNTVLIIAVAVGVGLFLTVSLLRILFQIKLSYIFIVLYSLIFILAAFTHEDFLAVAFDSGGVTTGPIMVPFVMAIGIGLASVRDDKTAEDDSFGLISLCAIGPIVTVMLLGMFYNTSSGSYTPASIPEIRSLSEVFYLFLSNLPIYVKDVVIALFPIVLFFVFFQIFALHLPKRPLLKIGSGIIYTFIGLVLFLTGVNVGFMPAGNFLGSELAGGAYRWTLIPLGMLLGFFIVAAEPAVSVLKQQVEDITEGHISGRVLGLNLSIGVAISVGLSMLRVVKGISIWYMILPGYILALVLTFFVSPLFTAIAFDSGSVASGPLTATFLLPFAVGATQAIGGNILTDAFGIVAMVAMTPLITIQILGVVYRIKSARISKDVPKVYVEDTIIDYNQEEPASDGKDASIVAANAKEVSEEVTIQLKEDSHIGYNKNNTIENHQSGEQEDD
ncbi:MAG: DUF1538 domain-containing protein [Lachnospiraceae bacterium]|jgi:hypothetical protein|nr:DUF1538 domain-containing protein [Lachnospiraceae bacterium]